MTIQCPCCGHTFKNALLNETQKRLLDYIRRYRKEQGCSPTFREMSDAMGVHSKGRIHKLIRELVAQGALVQEKYRKQGIMPVDELIGAA